MKHYTDNRVTIWIIAALFAIGIVIGTIYVTNPIKSLPEHNKPKDTIIGDTNNIFYKYKIDTNSYNQLVDTIKYFEGLELEPYHDNGYWYVGYGHQCMSIICINHLIDIDSNDTIKLDTINEYLLLNKMDTLGAIMLLKNDINKSIIEANRLTHLTGNKLLCIADFVYNFGSKKLYESYLYKLITSPILNDKLICTELSKWCYVSGKPNARLYNRRQMDCSLFAKVN